MNMKHHKLMRWHVWLGWLIGVPIIIWTASGLLMVAQPIETVRGNHLRSEMPALAAIKPVAPLLEGRQTKSLTLQQNEAGPYWVIAYADGGKRRADALTGALLPPVSAAEADALARAARSDAAAIRSVTRFDADKAPMDQRSGRPAWQVVFDDDARFYIDADTGELLSVRTKFWRAFDFMWGLHIMDLQTREDTSHPILIGSAMLALLGSILGFVMLFTRRRRRKVS
ncbi:PepSY domain-containing protein [uncultured Parasphingorhabdus sp.]|uniref:PepSY domain-containing protein n=1 Tax=uncultured Parasphingorhabdus sp. TaxID=2709694 RepID=UPI0030D80EDB|tara:strand:+ start:17583 stop:18263 length:681 start_codon:yes stop_codon:yes gene_type:complete